MQVVSVGFIIGVIQDSCETALNSSTDVLFTAIAEMSSWPKEKTLLNESYSIDKKTQTSRSGFSYFKYCLLSLMMTGRELKGDQVGQSHQPIHNIRNHPDQIQLKEAS